MRYLLTILLAVNLIALPARAADAPAVQAAAPACAATYAPNLSAKDLAAAKAQAPAVVTKCLDDFTAERKVEAFIGFALVSIAIALFAWWSEVLRDSDPVDFPGVTIGGKRYAALDGCRAFSLAQSQMMWWFWIVVSASVYTAIRYRDMTGGLNQQALILLTIGAGTAAGSAIIDQSRPNKGNAVTQYNDAMKALLNGDAPPTVAQADVLYEKMKAANQALKSDGFVADVVSDANGVSIHRFQALAWNAVLGVTYLLNVFFPEAAQANHDIPWSFVLPQFTQFQLGLLGISNGAYLGLKIPEATPSAPPAPAPAQPGGGNAGNAAGNGQ